MVRKIKQGILIVLIIFLSGCFEYRESLVFSPDYSGYADIFYNVPIYKEDDRSLIAYLPVQENKISEKYERYLMSEQFRLENYEFKRIKSETSEDRGQVSYRVFFSDPRHLEYLLIGKNKVYRQGGRLFLQRKFNGTPLPAEDASRIMVNLYSKVFQSFTGKNMQFKVIFPWYYDLVTNLGVFSRPGIHNYTLPLENTFNSANPVVWNIELKANPVPEAGF